MHSALTVGTTRYNLDFEYAHLLVHDIPEGAVKPLTVFFARLIAYAHKGIASKCVEKVKAYREADQLYTVSRRLCGEEGSYQQ